LALDILVLGGKVLANCVQNVVAHNLCCVQLVAL